MSKKLFGILVGICVIFVVFQISTFASSTNLVSEEKNGIVTEKKSSNYNLLSTDVTDLPQLNAPTELSWHENGTKGYISWKAVTESEGEYQIIVYKNNVEYDNVFWSGLLPDEGSTRVGINFSWDILDSGSYTFKVAAEGDDINNVSSDLSSVSSTYVYVKPQTVLGVPSNLRWDSENFAVWDGVSNAWGYNVDIFRDGQKVGGQSGALSDCKADFLDWMQEPGVYTFQVRAISNNIELIANGALSNLSPGYNTDVSENINLSLIDLINDNTDADGILSGLKNLNKSDLAVSMQTNEDVLSNIETLEEAYASEKGITILNNVDEAISDKIDVNSISIVGAAFNAGDTTTEMTLNFSQPNEDVVVDESQYKNVVQIDMKLEGAASETLDVPVRITMPIPTGVSESRLSILHYHADGTYETIFPIQYNDDGTVSFTLTSFSTFAFTETVYVYNQYDNAIYISGYEGNDTNILIPSKINGINVEGIEAYAFNGNISLLSVLIPKTVIYISSDAFKDCVNLRSVTIFGDPTIESGAFDGCDNLTIYGFSNMSPEIYANDNSIDFVTLGKESDYVVVIDQLSYTSGTGEITATVYMANDTTSNENAVLFLAVYDSNDALIKASMKSVSLANSDITDSVEIITSETGLLQFQVKAFLWHTDSHLMPISKVYTKAYK